MAQAQKLQDLVPNAQLGHYTILEHVAEGGMGHVFRGFEVSLSREVAIKILKFEFVEDPEKLKAFDAEAQSIAALRHPNIVPIYFVGHQGELYYFVMPFVSGSTLDDWVEGAVKMTTEQAIWVMSQAIDALDWAYQHKIIHLDIKPSNFLVDGNGAILLTDFGLARSLSGAGPLDESGDCFGTPAYMCPEQIMQHPTDQRSDIYSLGATMYHLMTAEFLYDSESVSGLVRAHLERPFPFEAGAAAGLTPGWLALLDKMTRKDPAQRFQDYHELSQALHNVNRLVPQRQAQPHEENAGKFLTPVHGPQPAEHAYGLLGSRFALWANSTLDEDSRRPREDVINSIEKPRHPLRVTGLVKPMQDIGRGAMTEIEDLAEAMAMLPEAESFLKQLAESPFSITQKEVNNRRKVIRAVGLELSSGILLTCLMLRQAQELLNVEFNWQQLWQHSVATGVAARYLMDVISGDYIPGKGWAEDAGGGGFSGLMKRHLYKARTEVFYCGVMHDVGKIVLGEVAAYPYYCALRTAIDQAVPLNERERALMGVDHHEAAERWMVRNGFDPLVRQVAQVHSNTSRKFGLVVSAVLLANKMVKIYGIGYSGNPVIATRDLWKTLAWSELQSACKNPAITPALMEEHFLPLVACIPALEAPPLA